MDRFAVEIDRAHWLRGHGDQTPESALLTESTEGVRLQCCMGTVCTARGIPDVKLRGEGAVKMVDALETVDEFWHWQSDHDFVVGDDRTESNIRKVYKTNDEEDMSDADREARLIEICAPHGLDLTFVGEGHPDPLPDDIEDESETDGCGDSLCPHCN